MALDPKNCQPEQEQHEEFYSHAVRGKRVQYDYRHTNGELFSCIKKTLDDCRIARDEWLARKGF